MAGKNWLSKLAKLDGAIADGYDPMSEVLTSSSPSFNYCFGNNWGLPVGYTAVFWGPPKGGKSLMANDMIGTLHRTDPDGIAIKFDTEFRDRLQLTPRVMALNGIDRERYLAFEVNDPASIFDRVETEIAAACQDGMPLKLVVIDSVSNIQGRRAMNANSVSVQQIGDEAKTLQDGFKRILSYQRKYRFAIILITQQRAEMDELEQRRGNKTKMSASNYLKHYAEYFMHIERYENADGRKDLAGESFVSDNKELSGKAELTGHKIRSTMKDTSVGSRGRTAITTFDYERGIINQHEEVFQLAKNRGIIESTGAWFKYGDSKWNGTGAVVSALADNPDLTKEMLAAVKEIDLQRMRYERNG